MTDPDIIKECRQTGRTRTTTKKLLEKAYYEQMTEITLNLTLEELKTLDKYVELNDETRPLFDKIQNAYPEPETLFDVIRNLGYSYDCCYEIVDAVEEFEKSKEPEKWDVVRESVKWCEEHPNENPLDYLKPQTPEQVDAGLRNAMRQAKKEGVFDKPTKPMNEVLDRLENKYENDDVVNRILKKWEENPPDFLRFELSKSLEDRIYKWWETCFVHHPEWSMEECVEDLLDIITLFLPGEQNSEGTQNIDTVVAVEVHNELLQKIKSKLRNKKDT